MYRQHFPLSSLLEQMEAASVKFDPLKSNGQSVADRVRIKCISRKTRKPSKRTVLCATMVAAAKESEPERERKAARQSLPSVLAQLCELKGASAVLSVVMNN